MLGQITLRIPHGNRKIANKWQSLSINFQACTIFWHLPPANEVQRVKGNKLTTSLCIGFFCAVYTWGINSTVCTFFFNMKRIYSCRLCLLLLLPQEFIEMIFMCRFVWSFEVKWILLLLQIISSTIKATLRLEVMTFTLMILLFNGEICI